MSRCSITTQSLVTRKRQRYYAQDEVVLVDSPRPWIDLPFDERVGDVLASFCPALQRNENGSKFSNTMRLRSRDELFRMLDLYYRLHWWTRNSQLTGQDTGVVRLDIIMERRKALEWVRDPTCDWDTVEMGT